MITFLSLSGLACYWISDAELSDQTEALIEAAVIDEDQDGFELADDCDDSDAAVNPGASEVPYDGVDNDCDESTLDDDLDQDGFTSATDCDDSSATVYPGASEVPYDGVDNDCSESTLDDDLDQDGFDIQSDCDDEDDSINPGVSETPYDGVDNDCDEGTPDDDLDGDGYDFDVDCDDEDDDANPGLDETPYDGVDNDCDESTSDDDVDGDGYLAPEMGGDDCDDENAAVHPDEEEIPYDGLDNDCDETTSDDDVDGDGYVAAESGGDDCDDSDPELTPADGDGDGYSSCDGDCDDSPEGGSIFPGADEVCDGIDNDCDAATTESGLIDLGGVGYSSIQDAIDDAGAGDTITLCDGTYNEDLVIEDDLTLYSLNGPSSTVIQGTGGGALSASVVTVTSGEVSLVGLTITGGTGSNIEGVNGGGGIQAYSDEVLLIMDDCIVTGNSADYGAGVIGQEVQISNTEISNNVAAISGGGIYLNAGVSASLTGVTFDANQAGYGAGAYTYTQTLTITDSVFYNNEALATPSTPGYGGGAYWSDFSSVSISGSTFSENTAVAGGGLWVNQDNILTMTDALIESNSARYGGGMIAFGSGMSFSSTIFQDNEASTTEPGASSTGGGLYMESCEADFDAVQFAGNSSDYGGGFYATGDAINPAVLSFVDSQLNNNIASVSGGGFYLDAGSQVEMATTAISSNNSLWGAGLYTFGELTVDSCEITQNVASQYGGGARVGTDGVVTSIGSDWGSGGSNNSPDDVAVGTTTITDYSSYGSSASFVCTVDSCE